MESHLIKKNLIKANKPPLYWYLNSIRLCWTLFLNRWPFIKQYIKSVSCSWKHLWNVCALVKYCMLFTSSVMRVSKHRRKCANSQKLNSQKVSEFTSPLSIGNCLSLGYTRSLSRVRSRSHSAFASLLSSTTPHSLQRMFEAADNIRHNQTLCDWLTGTWF